MTTFAQPGIDEDRSTRRDFIIIMTGVMAVGGAAAVAWPLIDQMNPSADTLSLSSVEYDFAKVAVGQQVVILWRKQPLFIRHRTPAEIAAAVADDHAPMRDPATDASRHKPGGWPSGWWSSASARTSVHADLRRRQVPRLALPLPWIGLRHGGRIWAGLAPRT